MININDYVHINDRIVTIQKKLSNDMLPSNITLSLKKELVTQLDLRALAYCTLFKHIPKEENN